MKEAAKEGLRKALTGLSLLATGPYGWLIRAVVQTGIIEWVIVQGVDMLRKDEKHDMNDVNSEFIKKMVKT